MRVIAGRWRGRPLVAPPGQSTRPTADRVRESLFSMLASRLESFDGLAVLDLFAGSGALGIEALSRGAASCDFVEADRKAIGALRENLAALDASGVARTWNCLVESFVPSQRFHLIMADPPYASGVGASLCGKAQQWLEPGGYIAIETGRGDRVDPAELELVVERDIGRARITILRRT